MSASRVTRDTASRSEGRDLLARDRNTGIGVHDGLSALVATNAEADFLWLSSFAVSAAQGHPDIGLIDPSVMANIVQSVVRLSPLPIVVDMDAGYGDLAKVSHATRVLAHAGAAAVCIEDYPSAKRSSLYGGYERQLVSSDYHCERLQVSLSAAEGTRCLVIGRTEALVAGLGVDETLRRAAAYVDAGAHAVFVQAVEPDDGNALMEFCRRWNRRTPVFVAPTCYPNIHRSALFEAGVSHVTFANHAIRAAHLAMQTVMRALIEDESGRRIESQVSSINDLTREVSSELAPYFVDGVARVSIDRSVHADDVIMTPVRSRASFS